MSRLDQVARLYKILAARRYPIARRALEEQLECSEATIKRLIPWCRDRLGMPIRYDRSQNGYFLDRDTDELEIPGLWLTQDEIYSLIVIDRLLDNLAQGLVREEIGPFRQRLGKLLEQGGATAGEHDRIRLLGAATRQRQYTFFRQVAQAVLQRRRLQLSYHSRSRDQHRQRLVSPQRLTHYRDNWYLDAWCHERDALRIFSLDRITAATVQSEPAVDIDESVLDRELASAYGIFSGEAQHEAVIRFSPKAARWVAGEQWHEQQSGKWLDDGRYELRIPYSDATELIGDILRHGPDAEVVAPESLRVEIRARIDAMRENYDD